MRELNAIPGSYSAFRVYNSELMQGPYNLKEGTIIDFEMRVLNEQGWSAYKSFTEEKKDIVKPLQLAPKSTTSPPNGAQCVNSIWDGFKCVDKFGMPVVKEQKKQAPMKILNDPSFKKGFHAVIEKCPVIEPRKVIITRIGNNRSMPAQAQRLPMF